MLAVVLIGKDNKPYKLDLPEHHCYVYDDLDLQEIKDLKEFYKEVVIVW